ncbi:MAG: hypothetical protein H0Z29_07735 [Candidatus Marinimicrobia bacterium]|nr:hypothetical protein [Candidatus Neomarinimicrobiota bacterium]
MKFCNVKSILIVLLLIIFSVTIVESGELFTSNVKAKREQKVSYFSRYFGVAAGSLIGIAFTYFAATDVPGFHGPKWKNLLTVTPALISGPIMGKYVVSKLTDRLLKAKPKPVKGLLLGSLYGAIAGTVIFTSCFAPMLITGNYLGTIKFNNMPKDYIVIRLLGASIAGGIAYGGTFGALIGAGCGIGISFYIGY